MNTNWSKPKRNIFAGLNDLRKALAAGCNARLIRMRNEDCAYPIRVRKHDMDFRNYEFSVGYMQTRSDILRDPDMDDIHKHLTLNYKTCYGSPEAVRKYYENGCLSPDNFRGMGTAHLVRVEDMVRWLTIIGDTDRAQMFRDQYLSTDKCNDRHFWDFYRYRHGSEFAPREFKRKLWVVELLSKDSDKARLPWYHKLPVVILRALVYPLKYIPKRSVLRMDEYRIVTYRIGDVTNGLGIDIHVPKKFGFK